MADIYGRIGRLTTTVSMATMAMAMMAPANAQSTSPAPVMTTDAKSATEDQQSSQGLEEIVVTARRVAENLQNVPVAVTAFSGADLVKQNVQRLQDIGAFTPGLQIRQGNGASSTVVLALRGQLQQDILATLDPSVGIYVDGIYWARSYGLNGDFLDPASVQVLKGPQGTLFGRNTTGGALLINSQDPVLGSLSGRGIVSYGRFNEFQATGILNLPIGEKVALRVAGTRFQRDGYTTNVVPAGTASAVPANSPAVTRRFPGSPNGFRFDNRDRWNARAKLLIQPTETFSLLLSGEYAKFDENPSRNINLATASYTAANPTYSTSNLAAFYTGLVSGATPATADAVGRSILNGQIAFLNANRNATASNEVSYSLAETQTYNLIGTVDTSWGAVKLLTSYRRVESSAAIDLDGSFVPIAQTAGIQKLDQLSGELQFTGKAIDDRLDFAAGLFVFHENGFDQSSTITLPVLNPLTNQAYAKIDNDSIGGYGQVTMRLSDAFSFTGGLRYSVDDKGLEARNNNYNRTSGATICNLQPLTLNIPQAIGPEQCAFRRRDSFGGWSYTAGIDYKPATDVLLYAKVSRGFRSGGQNFRATSRDSFIPFRPEIATAYEVGLKSEFLDRRLRVNLAAYQSDVTDIQRTSIVPTATPGIVVTVLNNAGKARFRGFEADVQALVFDGFRLSGTVAHVDPTYLRFADAGGDRRQERFNTVNKWQASIAADYDTSLGGTTELQLHADYAWRDELPLDIYNFPANPANAAILASTTAPPLGLLGARATLKLGDHYELAVFGRNLTNERKLTSDLIVVGLGFNANGWQEPRTYGLSGTFKF